MPAKDPELKRLLVQELERHLRTLQDGPGADPGQEAEQTSREAMRRAVHALKGSAGLAGEPELASAMQRIERRLREGDVGARAAAIRLVTEACARLRRGESAAELDWPEPPDDLGPSRTDPLLRAQYVAEASDRLAAIDRALGRRGGEAESAVEVFRHVHTLKGAASAVGDEPMAWFCHGLEERLREGTARAGVAPADALAEVARYRAVIGGLLEDPEATLAALRSAPARARSSSVPLADRDTEIDATIRVPANAVDEMLDYLGGITVARERVAGRVRGARVHARALRRMRADLAEALRLIGPPRPWGAPAAALRTVERAAADLIRLGDELDGAAENLKQSDTVLRDDTLAARRLLSSMRTTPIRDMFTRLSASAMAEARRSGKEVVVRLEGADELVDRKLAEGLAEPCLQLARNAVAHGIETPAERVRLGKPAAAQLTLTAQRRGTRFVVTVSDDGAGVDVANVRERAVEAGVVTQALAEAADDQTLLELLFVPGFSTRAQSPDLLAGRGIGLDITLAAVQRLRGTIRLSSKHGAGFEARLDVPVESGLASVLWVRADGTDYAVPVAHARRVHLGSRETVDLRVPHLASCLDGHPPMASPYAVELDLGDEEAEPLAIGVDEVGAREEVLVRALSPLVWGMGPFSGAVVRGDGSVRLALDVHALAPRARAMGRVPEGRVSEVPSRPPPTRRSQP